MIHRFAVDKMLGRLATWLRIIGQDATYGAHLAGQSLLRHARSQGRTVLTRDRRLLQRHSGEPPVVFIDTRIFVVSRYVRSGEMKYMSSPWPFR